MKVDVAWMIPWPNAHGSISACSGASAELVARGASSIIVGKDDIRDVNARVYVLLGLDVAMAERVRHARPSAKIFLQNHSPWLFLECSGRDWEKWTNCLRWARRHDQHLAQVAPREYQSAVAAFGLTGLSLIPAIYPFRNAKSTKAKTDPPTIVIAHKDRPWKNIVGQCAAIGMVNKRRPVRAAIYLEDGSPRCIDAMTIFEKFGVEFDLRTWKPQREFREEIADASCGMCCTWAECYSQAALDFMTQGIPIVGSPANWACPVRLMASPDSIIGIVEALFFALNKQKATGNDCLLAAEAAQAIQREHMDRWADQWL